MIARGAVTVTTVLLPLTVAPVLIVGVPRKPDCARAGEWAAIAAIAARPQEERKRVRLFIGIVFVLG
jgi:hypothetical protein